MQMIRQIVKAAGNKVSLMQPVRGFLVRHQVFSRMVLFGVGQTAVLVVMEIAAQSV